jgi:hypothetical protein
MVEQELRVIEVERGECHALVLLGAADEEVPLTTVQPRERSLVPSNFRNSSLWVVGRPRRRRRRRHPRPGGGPGWPVPGCAVWLRRAQW